MTIDFAGAPDFTLSIRATMGSEICYLCTKIIDPNTEPKYVRIEPANIDCHLSCMSKLGWTIMYFDSNYTVSNEDVGVQN
jgi:hypothetical protein